jgi:uncharacterized protein YcgL (UPF0745 family)
MLLCQIYKSPRKAEMYLYMEHGKEFEAVPASLMHQFGEPQPVMLVKLEADRKLARADVKLVLQAIAEQGYYLQMPPSAAEWLQRNHDQP